MASRMGVREFRDSFTSIARDATEPVIVTNHEKIVGWFTPANRPQRSVREILSELENVRRSAEARGVDVAGRLRKFGLEDDVLFDDPAREAARVKPKRAVRKRAVRKRAN